MPKRKRSGKLITEDELTDMAWQTIRESGYSQSDVARFLNVSRSAIHYAIMRPERPLGPLRARIVAELGRRRVTGPFYLIQEANANPS